MKVTFKPKKAFIHVPGFGVVSKEDFGPEHSDALLKRAKKHGVDQDKFIAQHLVIASYGDLDIFQAPEDNGQGEAVDAEPKKKDKGKKLSDDEKLEAMIAEEEAQKNA